ncbi:ECF transporter S component [Fonticella tunisiensis]|uniref:Putative membrane protein n=1 Tax=Fonticella tunisiensis TaxID=1096341 RepID=A0A4R7KM72_9CLOT|nr:ECF transporter S component [Fonticella tunisiensis]TDT57285.1 putative membrane protein [Fonticella tunisiensis]
MNSSILRSQTNSKTKDMVTTSLLIALVFIATRFINLQLPISVNGGLVHLGNTMLFMTAIVFGRKKGAVAGAFGMGLFDLLSGGPWVAWAPFTFVIRGVMGYIIGSISNARGRNGNSFIWNLIGIVIASIWMIIGYYIAEGILYGNWITPINSIPGNLIQLIVGAVVGLPLAAALKRTKLV